METLNISMLTHYWCLIGFFVKHTLFFQNLSIVLNTVKTEQKGNSSSIKINYCFDLFCWHKNGIMVTFFWKVPSKAATMTTFPASAIFSLKPTISGNWKESKTWMHFYSRKKRWDKTLDNCNYEKHKKSCNYAKHKKSMLQVTKGLNPQPYQ